MEKRTKTLLLSILTLCICTALVVGGTFALFSDSVKVNNHLSAGNLDVGLYRTSYKEYVLNDKGLMVERDGEDDPKFDERLPLVGENGSDKELFIVSKAVPTSWYQATMEVSNQGSTAFDYGVRILWTDTTDETADDYCKNDEIIASQIRITITSKEISDEIADGKVTVTDENGENPVEINYVTFMLNECKDNDVSLGYILAGDPVETFTVKAEFVDDEVVGGIVNNDAMNSELKFDVQVYATQKTSLD